MKNARESSTTASRIQWMSDLIRLEITLWDRVDQVLQAQHQIPLNLFESLYAIRHAPEQRMRIGELAEALRVTVGGTSKIVDRLDQMGLVRREPDTRDRRASRIALTSEGGTLVNAATGTYETTLQTLLDPLLSLEEREQFHLYVTRLLRM